MNGSGRHTLSLASSDLGVQSPVCHVEYYGFCGYMQEEWVVVCRIEEGFKKPRNGCNRFKYGRRLL